MIRFLKTPHLPQGRVKSLIIGKRAAQFLFAPLLKLGIQPIVITSNYCLQPEISDHVDMLVNHLGNNNFVFADKINLELCKVNILNSNFSLILSKLGNNYPYDIALNSARVGNYLFANTKYTDSQIINHAIENKKKIIDIKQGYAKCSICVVDENSIITEDISIAGEAGKYNIDVLLVNKGEVELSSHHHGFIGGASFKVDKNTLAFVGNINEHSDYKKINSFLKNKNISAISLLDRGLFDIGSAILVEEEV